jgi:tetratricopeptide (TPR) repeat protein
LREHLRVQLMLALYRDGRQAEALAAYQDARRVLVEELGTEPGTDLQDLHQRILTADSALAIAEPTVPTACAAVQAAPSELPAGVSHLSGRDNELAMLARLMREAAAGRGSSVLIEGEPGIGKSALVRAALAEAPDAGCQVFWGAGDELGQALPLSPVLDALRVREPSANPRRTTILQVLRGEVAAGPGVDVSAVLAEQLLALTAELCTLAPTVLVIDDLQWADQASVVLWGRLARLARQQPLLLVGMMRPVPRREEMAALWHAGGSAARLRLSGLTEEAAAELIGALAGGKPDEKLLRLADGAAGNPLYLTELIGALARSSGLTLTDSGAAELTSGAVPGSLSATIADRLGFVPGWVREVLQAAALLGTDFAVPDLAIVLRRGVAELIPAIDEACAAGVLAETGSGLGFRHPLIRAALYDAMPAPIRGAWHRDVGHALAKAGAPVDRVARQLLLATGVSGDTSEPMDEWILGWLADTAPLLVGRAPQAAAELLRQAVASCRAGSRQHDALVGRFADALYRVGDVAEAELVASRALAHAAEPDLLVDLHWTLAQCDMRAGRSAESLARLDRVLAGPAISARHRAQLLVLAARTHCHLGQVEKAGRVAATALAAAEEAGDIWAIGWALHVLTIVTGVQGQTTDALVLFDRALTVTRADPAFTDLRLLLQINKAMTLGNLDRYEEALAAAWQARDLAGQAGSAVRLAQARCILGQLLFGTGQWDDAMAEIQVLQEDFSEPATACCDLGVAALICLHRGEVAAARRHLAAAIPHAERIGNRLIGPLVLARSLDCEQRNARPQALATLAASFAGNIEELEEFEDLLPDAIRLATETGDLATAKALAGHAAALAGESEIPHRQANAQYCRGLMDHDPARLLAAAEHYSDARRPLARAKALEMAASDFIRAGDRDRAGTASAGAAEIYASLGAVTDVARLRARFRAHG